MNPFLATTLFTMIIMVYWVISELFTVMFRFTGLPDEKARFQVMSLITGCGFTTRESEMIVSSRSRRRLARITMLFGYVFNITIVSAFINVVLSLKMWQMENFMISMITPLFVLLVIFLLMCNRTVHSYIDHLIEQLAGRLLHTNAINSCMLLGYIGQDSVAQITLRQVPSELRGKDLSESGLKQDHNILVMLVERPGQSTEAPTAETVFQEGDKLTVFGAYDVICHVFHAAEMFSDD